MITSFTFINAQSVNGIPLSELDVNYLRIWGRTNFLGNKMVVRFEFGQRSKFIGSKNQNITDSEGRRITFNTMIDAVNFISAYGYRLVQTFNTINGRTVYYHYILEKIGLINNQGVNAYSNTQNKHYNRSMNNGTYEAPENIAKPKKKQINKETQPKSKKTTRKSNSFLNKLDEIADKLDKKSKPKQETPYTEKEEPKVYKPVKHQKEKVACPLCSETGIKNSVCRTDGCNNGKIKSTCHICKGDYNNYNTTCTKCNGEGCEYCDYDGKACYNCDKGISSNSHNNCKGTGMLNSTCPDCNGNGFLVK